MTTVHMWIYPWDIARLGPEKTAALLDEMGVDAVSLAVIYHAGYVLSLINGEPELIYLPQGMSFGETNLTMLSRSLQSFNWLDFLQATRNSFQRRGIALRAWTIAYHDKFEIRPVVNAFGQPILHSPCPIANRGYLDGIIQLLTSSGMFDAIEIESAGFTPVFHGHHHEISGVVITPLLNLLLGLCFCDECRREMVQSSIDPEALRQFVRRYWEAVARQGALSESSSTELIGILAERPDLARWLERRADLVADALASSAKLFSGPMAYIAQAFARPANLSLLEGIPLAPPPRMREDTECVILAYGSPSSVQNDVRAFFSRGWTSKRLVVGLTLVESVVPSWSIFSDAIDVALEQGARRFSFYNFGILPKQRREWVARVAERIRRVND
ncbi:MAG: hypothetical protein OWU84_03220 [Firmicutes bacterium]|nr:hypothetical protein [Bacillota bacterium]